MYNLFRCLHKLSLKLNSIQFNNYIILNRNLNKSPYNFITVFSEPLFITRIAEIRPQHQNTLRCMT